MKLQISPDSEGKRLDLLIAEALNVSRSKATKLIRSKLVTARINIKPSTPFSAKLLPIKYQPESIFKENTTLELNIIFEDEDLIVINKPAGIVVHPAINNLENTISQALVKYYPKAIEATFDQTPLSVNRAGIVHRLDKETSGVMVLAKNRNTLMSLQEQFKDRTVRKEYLCICAGEFASQTVDMPISRDMKSKMKRKAQLTGKSAVTEFINLQTKLVQDHLISYMRALPQTGRTHQIRVHSSYAGHPIIGDHLYQNKASKEISKALNVNRVLLHAAKISFTNQSTNKTVSYEAPIPNDLSTIINKMSS